MPRSALWLFLCPSCETGVAFGESLHSVDCPKCRYRTRYPGAELFGAAEWEEERRHEYIEGCFDALNFRPSFRKRRLLFTAVACIGFGWCAEQPFWAAIGAAEQWADAGEPRPDVGKLAASLNVRGADFRSAEWDWRNLAQRSLEPHPASTRGPFRDTTKPFFADAYRELFPNPFVPLDWNPEWFTSTVRDLASHVYTAHEFGTMPILADALQDAGCNDEQILNHCRRTGPHARGCWVLDAVLEKS